MEGLGLPSELTSRPFTVAQGREAGLRLRPLRSTRLHVPTHGVRMISTPAAIQTVNAAITTLSAPNVIIFDSYSLLLNPSGQTQTDYYQDTLHLNPSSYAILNESLEPVLLNLK